MIRLTNDLSCEGKGLKCLVLYSVIFLGNIPSFFVNLRRKMLYLISFCVIKSILVNFLGFMKSL